jgi:hypothetical protein
LHASRLDPLGRTCALRRSGIRASVPAVETPMAEVLDTVEDLLGL